MLLIAGGTGFVGRHLTARLVAEGEAVRVLARRPAELPGKGRLPGEEVATRMSLLRGDGRLPGAQVVTGDVTDLSSLLSAVEGCQAVIHLVGIIRESRGQTLRLRSLRLRSGQTYRSVHVRGTANVIEACRRAGAGRLLHMSALGTRERAASRYHQSKWQAERLVRASGLDATIFRPSVIFGTGGAFLPTIRRLVTASPVIPIIGDGMSLLQPIWVEDVVTCFVGALRRGDTAGHSYELGGPETYGFEQLVDLVAETEGVEKPKVHLPVWLMRVPASIGSRLTSRFPLTPDELTMLLEDNCCDIAEMRQTFGITPASLRDHLGD
jgi:NADH dehydrogenase